MVPAAGGLGSAALVLLHSLCGNFHPMNVLRASTGARGDLFDVGQRHDYRCPIEQPPATEDSTFLASLVETAAFKRLKGISFLGAINYSLVPSPNGSRFTRFTRAQHSLGVLRLALTYCDYRALSQRERRLISAAALLHDIGHPPLSHSIEGVLAEKFGIDHHGATQNIICGRISLGREVLNALRSHRVDVESVAALVAGQMPDFDGFFSGPLTFDTIEGVSRFHQYLQSSPQVIPSPQDVIIAAIMRNSGGDQRIVDGFWNRKHDAYAKLVHSHKGILADYASQVALRNRIGMVSLADYFGDDQSLFAALPGLREVLTSKSMEREVVVRFGTPDFYTARKYYVDESGDFFLREDDVRYRHMKFRRRADVVQRGTLSLNDDFQMKQNEEIPF